MRAKRMRALGMFCVFMLATGATPPSGDGLALVNPDLRKPAEALMKAKGLPPPTPWKSKSLPQGVVERQVASPNGQPPVTIYIINARQDASSPRGAILYIHGGGYIGGDARQNLGALKALAARLNCVIVSAQYRLAPGARFPRPMEDNYVALKWLHDQAPALGVDRRRIAVLGESAGGGLAAMVTLAARERKQVPIAFQALVYPMLDDRTGTTRPVPDHIGQLLWTRSLNRMGWRALLGTEPGGKSAPQGSVPARVANLAGLPPTFIEVGSIDLFVDEDIEFARRLINAGVPTELLVVPGAFHAFELVAPQAPVSQQFRAALEAALSRALAPPSP